LSPLADLSLAERAAASPHAVAVVDAASGESWTFAALHHRATRLGPRLRARLVGEPTRGAEPPLTGLAGTTSLATFLVLHALIEAGLPFLPIHPRLTVEERRRLAESAGLRPDHVLDDGALAALVGELDEAAGARTVGGETLGTEGVVGGRHEPKQLLALLATSGTSGAPKLARLSRAAFVASARATIEALAITAADVWLLALPLCHIGGLSVLTRSVLAGTKVVLLPRFSPEAATRACEAPATRPTLFPLVPTMLRDWLRSPTPPTAALGLRALIVGGAGCPDELLDQCADRGLLALTTYGLTETCSQLALQPIRPPAERRAGSGQVLPGSSLTIVDGEGRSLPAGEVGEIMAGGPTLFDGYEGHPPRGGQGFPTGDLGHLDTAGHLHVEGRRTDRIVTGGENVAPLEVEAVARTFPGIADAVVFGVPDERWGEGVAIAVVPTPGTTCSLVALDAHLRQSLARFKCPRRFAVVAALPLNALGKLDRRRARAMYTDEVSTLFVDG
jgi:o-succinylbenzoate---CoA ligase